jgi:hypothetical protein
VKAQVNIAPGAYRLPGEVGMFPFRLPACLIDRSGAIPFELGTVEHSRNTDGDTDVHTFRVVQGLTAESRSLRSNLLYHAPTGTPVEVPLSGAPSLPGARAQMSLLLCASGESCTEPQAFDSCGSELYTEYVHHVDFEGGWIEFHLQLGDGFAAAPSAFVGALGSYSGVRFEQHDFFKLAYRGRARHSARDFAVLFDEPIGTAGGIEVEGFADQTQDDVEPMRVFVTDSVLQRLTEVSYSNAEILEP